MVGRPFDRARFASAAARAHLFSERRENRAFAVRRRPGELSRLADDLRYASCTWGMPRQPAYERGFRKDGVGRTSLGVRPKDRRPDARLRDRFVEQTLRRIGDGTAGAVAGARPPEFPFTSIIDRNRDRHPQSAAQIDDRLRRCAPTLAVRSPILRYFKVRV